MESDSRTIKRGKAVKESPYLTVTARPRSGDGKELVFNHVYDIGHYYSRNTGKEEQYIRLLIGSPFGKSVRQYIDLFKHDVVIHVDD